MVELSRDEMKQAVTEGVKQAFAENMENISTELVSAAISKGVADIFRKIAVEGYEDPGEEFYNQIKAGITEAMRGLKITFP
ncbi:hypothetical protein ACLF3G_26845 [Falsiroseomonas sp. HC035]|uniref:hypothetical protein n=1 Tax=Falsiroseomonas sp. HC035 TaxID=3390999 RepID=UPI003D31008C